MTEEEFFDPNGFIDRYRIQVSFFKREIDTSERESIKTIINNFYIRSKAVNISDIESLEIDLLHLETLNIYAQKFGSKSTFLSIINYVERNGLKERLFDTFQNKAKLFYGETLLKYYNLIKFENESFNFETLKYLLKSKSNLLSAYVSHIEKKTLFSDVDLSRCLTLLAACVADLSRWFEPLYYLNQAKTIQHQNPNIEYLRAITLNSMKDKTCLNYNNILHLKIIESCDEASSFPILMDEQKKQLNEIKTSCLNSFNINHDELKKHKENVVEEYKNLEPYEKFCNDNLLFLNEHLLFCKCKLASSDSLKIETAHLHTQIPWVKQFEIMLDGFIYDFNLARSSYYNSLKGTEISHSVIKRISRSENDTVNIKNSFLKEAFKICYSILDQIAHGILDALNINFKEEYKKNYKKSRFSPNVYFIDMWRDKIFTEKHFDNNFYLISLYSIAQDLNKTEYSALSDFKQIRNAMEHKLFFIKDEDTTIENYGKNIVTINRQELLDKTKILLLLTMSAIYSFTYLIRRESKIIEMKTTC